MYTIVLLFTLDDNSRVRISPKDGSDYINACFVDVSFYNNNK